MSCAAVRKLALVAAFGAVVAPALARPRPVQGPFMPPRIGAQTPRPPWHRRRRVGIKGMHGKGQGLIDLKRWPAEPSSPAAVEVKRLARALRGLCANWMPPRRPLRYAGWIVESAKAFGVDPFLLAALIYRQSRCLPKEHDDFGLGLAKINPRMHAPHIKRRRYHFHVLRDGQWQPAQLALARYAFVPGNLRRAQPNIYFAAALLSVWKQQCPAIDGAFGSVPHRHYVSHLIWGDRVMGAGAEDRVLRARRRLLAYYLGKDSGARGSFQSLALGCPLDGPPRKVSSAMGADRDDGHRRHRGIDFASTWGEPVRAVADGVVIIAGIDRRRGRPLNMPLEQARHTRPLGPGGLFVMIRHQHELVSAYMHLDTYTVRAGQKVRRGEQIGTVGRSGVRESGPHLHFELRHEGRHIDPMPHLAPYVFGPMETYIGRRIRAEQQRVRRRRRIKRWRERRARRAGERSSSAAK